MTFYPQCRITHKGKHRLHDRINELLIIYSAVTIAANYLSSGEAKFVQGSTVTLSCQQPDVEVALPVHGPLEAALANQSPDAIHIDFLPKKPEPIHFSYWAAPLGTYRHTSFGFVTLVANVIAPIFVEYYETYTPFIAKRYRGANNGHRFIGVRDADLNAGDIIVLMFEMSDLLDDEGCQI